MDQNTFDERTFAGILKTILLFLENYEFVETSRQFIKEISARCGDPIEEIVPRTLVLRRLSGELNKIVVNVTDSNEEKFEKTIRVHKLCGICPQEGNIPTSEDVDMLTHTLNKLKNEHFKLIEIATQFSSILGTKEDKGTCATTDIIKIVHTTHNVPCIQSKQDGEESENYIPLETKQVSKDIPAEMVTPPAELEEKDSLITSLHDELQNLIMNSVLSSSIFSAEEHSGQVPFTDEVNNITESLIVMKDAPIYETKTSPKTGPSSPRKATSPTKLSSPRKSSPTRMSAQSGPKSPLKKSKVKCCPDPHCETPKSTNLTNVTDFDRMNPDFVATQDSMSNFYPIDSALNSTCSMIAMAKSSMTAQQLRHSTHYARDDFNPDCQCEPGYPSYNDSSNLEDVSHSPRKMTSSPTRMSSSKAQSPMKMSASNGSSPMNMSASNGSSPMKMSASNGSSPVKMSPTKSSSPMKMSLSNASSSMKSPKNTSSQSPTRISKQMCCKNPNCEIPNAPQIAIYDSDIAASMANTCSRSRSVMNKSEISNLDDAVFNPDCKCDYTPAPSKVTSELMGKPTSSNVSSPMKMSPSNSSSPMKMSPSNASSQSPTRRSKQVCCKNPNCETPNAPHLTVFDSDIAASMTNTCSRSRSVMNKSEISKLDDALYNPDCKCDYTPAPSNVTSEKFDLMGQQISSNASSPTTMSQSPTRRSKQVCCKNPNCEIPNAPHLTVFDSEIAASMTDTCSRSRSVMNKSEISKLDDALFNPDCKCDYTPAPSNVTSEKFDVLDKPPLTDSQAKQSCCHNPTCELPEAAFVSQFDPDNVLGMADMLKLCSQSKSTNKEQFNPNCQCEYQPNQSRIDIIPASGAATFSSRKTKSCCKNVRCNHRESELEESNDVDTLVHNCSKSQYDSQTSDLTHCKCSKLKANSSVFDSLMAIPKVSLSHRHLQTLSSLEKSHSPTTSLSPTKSPSPASASQATASAKEKCCMNPQCEDAEGAREYIKRVSTADPNSWITLDSMLKSCKSFMKKSLGVVVDDAIYNPDCKCDYTPFPCESLNSPQVGEDNIVPNIIEESQDDDSAQPVVQDSNEVMEGAPPKPASKRSLTNETSRESSKSGGKVGSKSKVRSPQMSKSVVEEPRTLKAASTSAKFSLNSPLRRSSSPSGRNEPSTGGFHSKDRSKSETIGSPRERSKSDVKTEHSGSMKERSKSSSLKKLESLVEEEFGEGDQAGSYFYLKYDMIKNDLKGGKSQKKLTLLQALRWRLTKSSKEMRDDALCKYVQNDVLEMADSNFKLTGDFLYLRGVCKGLEKTFQEEMARFINCLASLSIGRQYLTKNPKFVEEILLPMLTTDQFEPITLFTKNFIIATVQKLSVNSDVRKILLNNGILHWLVDYINQNHLEMDNYAADYTTALLANLCLEDDARDICVKMDKEKVFQMLTVLAETPHECCVPYLNSIFFSLLGKRAINSYAMDNYFTPVLIHLSSRMSDDESRNQLKMIIKVHTSISFEEVSMDSLIADEILQIDNLENELEMNDPISFEPNGEVFLQAYRTRKNSIRSPFMSLEGSLDMTKGGGKRSGGRGSKFSKPKCCEGWSDDAAGGRAGGRKGKRGSDRNSEASGSSDRSRKRKGEFPPDTIYLSENAGCLLKAIEIDKKTCKYSPKECYDFYYCDPLVGICQRQNLSCKCYNSIKEFIQSDCGRLSTPERNYNFNTFCSDDCNRASLFNSCRCTNYTGC